MSLFHRGNYDAAQRQARLALRACPVSSEAHVLLGRVLLLEGVAHADRTLLAQAKSLLEAALTLDSQSQDAQQLLELFVAPPP